MISLPILANLNIGYRKAAAPNKGRRPSFIRQISTIFIALHWWGSHQKKHCCRKGLLYPPWRNKSKLVEKWLVSQCGKKSLLFWKNFFQKTQDLALPNWDRE